MLKDYNPQIYQSSVKHILIIFKCLEGHFIYQNLFSDDEEICITYQELFSFLADSEMNHISDRRSSEIVF